MIVLVTGADGQLAYAVRERFETQHKVVALSRSELDVTDSVAVHARVRAIEPTVVVNGAAYNDVDGAEEDPETALAVNAFGVRSLACAAAEVGATLVHFSTDFVFDGEGSEPYREDATPNPQSVYGVSKLLGEWFAREVPHYVLRVESVFGAGAQVRQGAPRGSSIDRMADAMLEGREFRAFQDRTVSPSYVDDVAEAVLAILDRNVPHGLYHCVGSGLATWVDVAAELARCLNCDVPVIPIRLTEMTLKARRPLFCALSNQKLVDAGVTMPTWRDAVARYATRRLDRA